MTTWTYSGNIYDASPPGTTTFPLTTEAGNAINYLQRSHIHVYKSADSGATYTELTFASDYGFNTEGAEIILNAGIAAGEYIKLLRITPYETEYVEYQESSQLTAGQLNTGEKFSMYVDQELYDQIAVSDADKGITDAPNDGNLYGRESEAWVEVPPPGISDAPTDSKEYVRYNSTWKEATETPYVLPTASAVTLGGIKVGANLTIDGDGILSATGGGGGGLIYKGLADFTAAAPSSPSNGDLYLNDTVGVGSWPGFIGVAVGINDRAFFNGLTWDRLPGGGGGSVTSVNSKVGDVVLDAADVGAATTVQGANADSAVQPGDLATVATTGAYSDLTGTPTIPVDSVNTQTGAVVLDADDIDDTATANKFATAGELADIGTALQPADIGVTVQGYNANNVVSNVAPTFTATVQTTERTITAGAFDLATGNHWTCGAITVPAPTNAVAGTSGLIRITAGPVTWNAVFKFPGGSAPTVASFPAVIPFYVQSSSVFLMGNVVEGIA